MAPTMIRESIESGSKCSTPKTMALTNTPRATPRRRRRAEENKPRKKTYSKTGASTTTPSNARKRANPVKVCMFCDSEVPGSRPVKMRKTLYTMR